MRELWHRLFLEERPSIGLSFFRIIAALTTGFVVLPTFVHMQDTYLSTAYNTNFFPIEFIQFVQKSPEWVIYAFVWLFCVSFVFMLIGLIAQISCILMTVCCYYFYALNYFAVGTLSWDILLVTLFLMCLTPYPGDYFSLDCLLKGDANAYKRKRPFFLQRMLQFQVAFTFFYTAMHKITVEGNWLRDNPIYYLMNEPPSGVTKLFSSEIFLLISPNSVIGSAFRLWLSRSP